MDSGKLAATTPADTQQQQSSPCSPCDNHTLLAAQAFGGCKHFVPYDGAALSHASDYDLFSTYLPGFARCVEAGALNMMCSYTW